MSKITGEEITGREYLEQRFADAFSTRTFALVVDRRFGSDFDDLVDRNIDDEFRMLAFSRAAATIRNPLNGLDDISLNELELQQPEPNTALVIAHVDWEGQAIELAAELQVAA